ncbi:WD40 repeat domain-containing protein [Streptomyces sp. NBC_01485]|uniref:WD40 repeat domain-containing protein n=1 Tax=Streptomyces sp. NBC_01485 TaxID=2903884 RepID=UPI002E2EA5AD|nr:WD40 repeat domain-containing protein [Streptomyces sp. NBC_01485]
MAEDRPQATDVRDLLRGLPPGTNVSELYSRLTGAQQPLWAFLTRCVAEDDAETLRLLMEGRTPLHDVLDEAPSWVDSNEPVAAPFVEDESVPARALRAYAALGLALVGDLENAEEHLRVGTSWLLQSAAAAPTAIPTPPWTPDPDLRHGERLGTLVTAECAPASVGGHLSLVLLALDGGLPKPLRGPRLTVLADRGDYRGARFELRLDLVRELPPGLLPDPRCMTAFLGDEGFRRSLADAWATARPAKLKGAVLWSLSDGDGPVDHVSDSSFGAAFAVLLTELGRTAARFRGPLRLRRVNPSTAVVGSVSAANPQVVESVTGYNSKLSVVSERDRVVVPKRDEAEARKSNPNQAAIVGVVTVEEAAKAIRRLDGRATSRLLGAVLVTSLVAALVAWGFASHESEQNNRKAVAIGLATKAVKLSGTDPRTAGLLALAGYRIDPKNTDAKDAMQEVLETNRNMVRSWVADKTVVDVLAVDDTGHRVYTSGGADAIRVWDTRSGRKLAAVKGRAAGLVRDTESGILAAHDGRELRLFDTSGDVPQPLGDVKAPSCVGQFSEIKGMAFTANSSALTLVWNDGSVTSIDPVSRTTTACLHLGDIAGKDLAGQLPQGRPVMSADIVPGSTGLDGAADEAVILLTTNDVVSVDLRTKKVSRVVPASEVPRAASLVQASDDMVTLATEGGVLAWDREQKSRIAYPLGGLSSQPKGMQQDGDLVVIAGPSGTAVIPVRSSADSATQTLSVPSGGRSVAAVRASDGTVVAAGDGARVTVLANTPVQRALPPAKPSTGATFGPGHTLLLSDFFMTNSSYGAYTVDIDSAPDFISTAGSSYETVVDYSASASYINSLAMSDKFVAAAGQSGGLGSVQVWKKDGTFLQEILMSPEDDRKRKAPDRIVAQVGFVPEAGLMVARHTSGDVGIWSTKNWDRLGTISLEPGTTAMVLHGRTGYFTEGEGQDTQLVEVDLVTRRKLRTVATPRVARLSLSADGSRLLTLDWETNTVSLLDSGNLKPLIKPLSMPAGDIATEAEISPDGRLVATAQGDHVLVHNLASGRQTMPPLHDTNGNDVVSLAWSPDGAYLVGATLPSVRASRNPGPVDIWKLAEGSLEKRMCDWADGDLSRDEWKKYVNSSVEYINLCEGVTE